MPTVAESQTAPGNTLGQTRLRAREGVGLGFSDLDRVSLAAALVPHHEGPSWRHGDIAPDLGYWLRVSPGVIGLRSGRVQLAERLTVELPAQRSMIGSTVEPARALPERAPVVFVVPVDAETANRDADETAGRMVRGWSARSRARMVRTLGELDYGPLLTAPGCRPGMITLTYPGDWQAVAPNGEAVKRHVKALRARYRRAFGHDLIGTWKLEFQRRGAPHLHAYVPVPVGLTTWKAGRGRGAKLELGTFADWLSWSWYEVVGSGDERHLRAGTGIDFGLADRCSDPKRLAVYFTKHGSKSAGKAYQNDSPDEWGGITGRYWGVWGLRKLVVEAPVSQRDAVEVRRLLRALARSQRRTVSRRDRMTGKPVLVERRGYSRSFSTGMVTGGFLVVNDAPRLAGDIGRYLSRRDFMVRRT